jgi:5-methylcytosine-specific restriction enzyme B
LAWIWLGSDNNKGVATVYDQGIRALARCKSKISIPNKRFEIELEDVFILPQSIDKQALLNFSPDTYARDLADATIVGLNNYSSQVVQILTDKEFATIGAIVGKLAPEIEEDILAKVPGAAEVEFLGLDKSTSADPKHSAQVVSAIGDDDEVLLEVRLLIEQDGWGGVLLTGVAGTGKTWYARELAIKLTGGDPRRIREVQFHPSYQYEDFVEGYVPDGKQGFRLADKHMLQMAEVAKNEEGPVVLVIDEFSRTDPSRVLGETMTYMEGSKRGIDFYLPSGRRVNIPKNLFFIATMNPEDRSVDEIDAAMERRWAKVELKPDPRKLKYFLEKNGAAPAIVKAAMDLFLALQGYLEIGHAFFCTVKDRESAARLWNNQLRYVIHKRFRFDSDTRKEIEDLWTTCDRAMQAASGPITAPHPTTANSNLTAESPGSGTTPDPAPSTADALSGPAAVSNAGTPV